MAAVSIELAMFAAGAVVYLMVTRARDRLGSIGLWASIAFLSAIYFAAIFGPPPPSAAAVAGAGHASWLLVGWAYWIDRHRTGTVTAWRARG